MDRKMTIQQPVRALAFTLVTTWAIAPTTGAAANNESAPDTEEINVYAEMSLRKLRLETNSAQKAMFNVFNEHNSDDRFDIKCEYIQRWQSKIREYTCRPTFLKRAQEEEVNLFLRSIGGEDGGHAGAQGGGAGVTQMDYFNALLQEEMEKVYQENAEFREAMDDYELVREVYELRLND